MNMMRVVDEKKSKASPRDNVNIIKWEANYKLIDDV